MAKVFAPTAAQIDSAEAYTTMAAAEVLEGRGLLFTGRRFARNGRARRKLAEQLYAKFVNEGGKVGDWQSFLYWLLEHGDEIIAFISKILLLFAI